MALSGSSGTRPGSMGSRVWPRLESVCIGLLWTGPFRVSLWRLRLIMTPKAALLAGLLMSVSASQASPLPSGFWDSFSQLTHDKDSLEQAQQLELGQGMSNLKESLQDGANYVGNVLEKLAPLNRGFHPQFSQDAHGLRRLISGEIESLRMKLSPPMDEVCQKISQSLENLRLHLTPITEELIDQVSLRARELRQHFRPSLNTKAQVQEGLGNAHRFAASYARKMAFLTDQVKEIFHPYTDRLVSEIRHSVEELHKNVVPQATVMREQLSQSIQEFSDKLIHNVRELQLEIERNLQHLLGQLSLHSSALRSQHFFSSQEDLQRAVHLYLADMAQEAQERIEAFRRDATLHIDNFTKTTEEEMAEMTLKLSPPPPYLQKFQENSSTPEDWHVRLATLWKDIAQSLSEPSGSFY
ncbi:apolipoprotein A-V [Elgaria multicarinata webbii]|uniref:apolipoprotein A-V n=1 Tax=Elgaria multicarinata webbii TaxID=159646 RepID=UPI002FCD1F1E